MTSPPQWSFASRHRLSRSPEPPLSEALRSILTWLRVLRGRKPTLREQIREAKLVEALAEELAEEETPPAPAPKRPKRT